MSEQTREELERIKESGEYKFSSPDEAMSGKLASALLAVLDLHKHKEGLPHCPECGETYCRTVQAIEREMGRGGR